MPKLTTLVIFSLGLSTLCGSLPAGDHPNESSLKLAREILSYFKGQREESKQFFPYYPIDPYPR